MLGLQILYVFLLPIEYILPSIPILLSCGISCVQLWATNSQLGPTYKICYMNLISAPVVLNFEDVGILPLSQLFQLPLSQLFQAVHL